MKQAVLDTSENSISKARGLKLSIGRVFQFQEAGLLVAILIFMLLISFVNPAFIKSENLMNLARVSAFTFIVSCGLTFCLVGGGLDLSVGSVYGAAGILGAVALVRGVPVPLAILMGLGISVLIGAVNGFIITRVRIPPLIVTLGMLYAARGAVMVISQGDPIYRFPEAFNEIGQGSLLGIPNPILLAVVFGLICHFVLEHTRFGYAVHALGGNEEAARVCGVNVSRMKFWLYIITAFSAGFTGLLMTSRLGSSHPNSGVGLELVAISSVIIGGTSLFGGVGTILGTVLGALLLNMITNGIVLMGIDLHWQNIVVGTVIVLAVGIDQFRRIRFWRRGK